MLTLSCYGDISAETYREVSSWLRFHIVFKFLALTFVWGSNRTASMPDASPSFTIRAVQSNSGSHGNGWFWQVDAARVQTS